MLFTCNPILSYLEKIKFLLVDIVFNISRISFYNDFFFRNDKCNTLEGAYDGTVFPHDIQKDWQFRIYRKLFCRTVPIYYDHTGYTKDGFEAYYFKVLSNFLDKYEDNPLNECYCRDKDYCLPAGLGDLSPCTYGKRKI